MMSYYAPRDGDWTETSAVPEAPPYIEVDAEAPEVHFIHEADKAAHLSGAPARSPTETVHTVAIVEASLRNSTTLCALRADENDLTVEDRRPPEARTQYTEALDHLHSAMDEILIPVYIDDAIEELSETVQGLVALHTARYEKPPQESCSYFRTSVFQNGALLLEAERGSL